MCDICHTFQRREMSTPVSLLHWLRTAGMSPNDSEELRLQKSLLIFATGLACLTSVLWLLLYWQIGPRFSSTIPFVFQLLLAGNLLIYLKTQDFDAFRVSQLSIFLFLPFVAQWSIGNFITASGISLWGLLAPIGAVLVIGARESQPWFFAYIFLTALSGAFDIYLADSLLPARNAVPAQATMFFFALNFTCVSTIVYLLLRYAAAEKQKAQARLQDAHRLLQIEQERSERLLLNILPGPVAERLKNSTQTIADGFADVTVMFADIVNFTELAAGLTPQQVFAMLNRIFSAFDELAERYGLEKIKTIGDAYMVAGGLNGGNSEHSLAIANMALDMCEILQRDSADGEARIELRIGIGSGPVVAGVVGKKKFIYDLWGDTVNIASRITCEGVPGKVQVDDRTYRRIADHFDFLPPETVVFKGKGPMVVHRLAGRRLAGGERAEDR